MMRIGVISAHGPICAVFRSHRAQRGSCVVRIAFYELQDASH